MATALRTRKQTWCLLAALVLGAVLISICGIQWLQRGYTFLRPLRFSHDGTKFLADVGHPLVGESKFAVYDSASGDLLCNLRGYYHHCEYAWSSDDTKLVGLFYGTKDRGSGIAVLDVTGPEAEVLRTWPVTSGETFCAFFDAQDRVIQINMVLAPSRPASTSVSANPPERNRLVFIGEDNEVRGSIEFGLDEEPELLSSVPGVVTIGFRADKTAPKPDVVFTKKQRMNAVQFDMSTAEELRQLGRQDVDDCDSQTTYDFSKQGVIAIHRRDLATPILEIPTSWKASRGPVALGSDHFLMYDNIYEKHPMLFKPNHESFDQPLIPPTYHATSMPNGDAMLFTKAGKLVRLNPVTGKQRIVKDFRPNAGFYRTLATAGVPLLWAFLYYAGTRRLTRCPFGEVAVLILTTCVIFASWSWFGTGGGSVQVLVGLGLGYGFLTAAIVFGLIWCYVSKSPWGVVAPVGIIYAAIILAVFAVWAAGETPRFVQAVMAALLIAVWQALLLVGFRRFVGKVEHKEAPAVTEVAHQFTLRQGFYFTGSVASLLAIAQFLKWDGVNLLDIGSQVIFLLGFGAVLTAPATFAMWITLRMENPIWSCLLSVLSVVAAVHVDHNISNLLPAMPLRDDVALRYGPSLIVTFVIWFGIRYCRAHGFRLARRAMSKQRSIYASS